MPRGSSCAGVAAGADRLVPHDVGRVDAGRQIVAARRRDRALRRRGRAGLARGRGRGRRRRLAVDTVIGSFRRFECPSKVWTSTGVVRNAGATFTRRQRVFALAGTAGRSHAYAPAPCRAPAGSGRPRLQPPRPAAATRPTRSSPPPAALFGEHGVAGTTMAQIAAGPASSSRRSTTTSAARRRSSPRSSPRPTSCRSSSSRRSRRRRLAPGRAALPLRPRRRRRPVRAAVRHQRGPPLSPPATASASPATGRSAARCSATLAAIVREGIADGVAARRRRPRSPRSRSCPTTRACRTGSATTPDRCRDPTAIGDGDRRPRRRRRCSRGPRDARPTSRRRRAATSGLDPSFRSRFERSRPFASHETKP